MRWLVAAALTQSTLTYGQMKRLLEDEAGFSTIFPTRIGFVAGLLMERLQAVEPKAPLLNVLVVNGADGLPSRGAGFFMARRFGVPKLAQFDCKRRYPVLWRENFERAAQEVYAYSQKDWDRLYRQVFKAKLDPDVVETAHDEKAKGKEHDFGTGPHKYGKGGEGEHHRLLRLWVKDNPGEVRAAYRTARTDTELPLDSGDRVDVAYFLRDRTVLLEVKSRVSNEADILRGVYQCVKYRAVKAAMDARHDPLIEVYLVTEDKISTDILGHLRRLGIKHFQAPRDRQ